MAQEVVHAADRGAAVLPDREVPAVPREHGPGRVHGTQKAHGDSKNKESPKVRTGRIRVRNCNKEKGVCGLRARYPQLQVSSGYQRAQKNV